MPTVPPPDLPHVPGLPAQLIDYLRKSNRWAFEELEKKVPKNEAVVWIMLSASDQKNPTAVFKLQVDHTGAVHVTQMPLGGGAP